MSSSKKRRELNRARHEAECAALRGANDSAIWKAGCYKLQSEADDLRAQLKEAQEAAEFNFKQYQDAGRLLCEAQAEIERLYSERGIISGHLIKKLHGQLAASQANEVQLRDGIKNLGELAQALDSCGSVADSPKSVWAQSEVMTEFAQKLLSLPSDTTALEAMIKKAGEVMRERCAEWLDERVYYRRESEAIRAIPGVTLEDLK